MDGLFKPRDFSLKVYGKAFQLADEEVKQIKLPLRAAILMNWSLLRAAAQKRCQRAIEPTVGRGRSIRESG
jgi:hypothetical protein